jgi:hypothetical protein
MCSFLVIVEDLLCEFLPLAVAGEGLALQDQDPLGLQLNNSVCNLKRDCLTRWIWLLMTYVWLVLGLNRGRGHFLNFLAAPMIL